MEDNATLDAQEHTAFELIDTPNVSTLLTTSWTAVATNLGDSPGDFDALREKLFRFVVEQPTIVNRMRLVLADHFIEHIIKRTLSVTFTEIDYHKTQDILQKLFVEDELNIEFIFNYFYEDLRLLVLMSKLDNLPWTIRQAFIYSPKSVLWKLTKTFLQYKGAQMLTNKTFENILPCPPAVDSSINFNNKNVRFFCLMLLFVLLSINVSVIGFMVNFVSVFIFILLILYYSLQMFK